MAEGRYPVGVPRPCAKHLGNAEVSELIGFFVAGVPGVSLDPNPLDSVATHQFIEPLP